MPRNNKQTFARNENMEPTLLGRKPMTKSEVFRLAAEAFWFFTLVVAHLRVVHGKNKELARANRRIRDLEEKQAPQHFDQDVEDALEQYEQSKL